MNCNTCGKSENLKECGNCHNVYYCSRDCQFEDWLNHKKTCLKKILYLGMAEDIWTVLQLEEDFDTIYVIDDFDEAYAFKEEEEDKTVENQRELIKRVITDGNNSAYDDVYYFEFYKLRYKGIIQSESLIDNVWRLNFKYGSRNLKLIIHYKDFRLEEWPKEINHLSHVLMIGSGTWQDLENPLFLKMMTERTEDTFLLTALNFLNEHFPIKTNFTNRYYDEDSEFCEAASIFVKKQPDGSINLKPILK